VKKANAMAKCLAHLLAALAFSWDAFAQSAPAPWRVGVLSPFSSSSDPFRDIFQQRLREFGKIGGREIALEYRSSENRADRLPSLANELARLKVDLIVTTTAPGAQAARQATATIPIVMAGVNDAVAQGFVASLARPGGNVTGITWLDTELSAKRLELLHRLLPKATRVGFLREAVAGGASLQAMESAARALGLQLVVMELRAPQEIDGIFRALGEERVSALVIAQSPMIAEEQRQVVALAKEYRMPTIFPSRAAVEAGALMSYGPKPSDLYRRAAEYVQRILNGSAPSALPVEQPTDVELVLNLRAAKELRLEVPETLFAAASEVIR
jgi:putative tryptophan/tyrosine transport system substrate-binding protein